MFKCFLDIAEDICPLNGQWIEWERVAKSLPKLIKSGNIRNEMNSLPEVKLDGLSRGEIKRAYTIVTFIAHAYIRGSTIDIVIKVKSSNITVF